MSYLCSDVCSLWRLHKFWNTATCCSAACLSSKWRWRLLRKVHLDISAAFTTFSTVLSSFWGEFGSFYYQRLSALNTIKDRLTCPSNRYDLKCKPFKHLGQNWPGAESIHGLGWVGFFQLLCGLGSDNRISVRAVARYSLLYRCCSAPVSV